MGKIIYSHLNNEEYAKAVELYFKVCDEPGGELIYRFEEKELIQMLQAGYCIGTWDMELLVGLGILVLGEDANKTQRDLLKLDRNISMAEVGFYVDYNYRGKGIAKALSDELTNHAVKIGINVITASAREENIPSNKILIDQNFVLAGKYDRGDGYQRNVYRKDLAM